MMKAEIVESEVSSPQLTRPLALLFPFPIPIVKLHLRVSLTSRSVWQGNQVSLLLVDEEGLLIQAVLGGDLRDLTGVIVLQLVNVADHLALVRANGSEHEKILEVAVLAER